MISARALGKFYINLLIPLQFQLFAKLVNQGNSAKGSKVLISNGNLHFSKPFGTFVQGFILVKVLQRYFSSYYTSFLSELQFFSLLFHPYSFTLSRIIEVI